VGKRIFVRPKREGRFFSTATRAQRQAPVQQMLEEIDRIEAANQAKLQTQTMQRVESEMRQDMMQRSLSPLLR
jgi:hypothetical protein